jgi:hypothetical protein
MGNAVAWARGRKRADPERTRWALWQAIAAAEQDGGDVRLSPAFARTLAAELDHLPRPNGRPVASVDHELRQERLRREYREMRAQGVPQTQALAELTREVRAEGQPVSEEAVKKWVQGDGSP